MSEALTKPVAPTIVLPDAAGRSVPARPVHGRSSSAPLAPRAAQDLLTLGGLIDFAGSYDEYLEKHGDDYLKARLGAKSALKS